MTGNLKNRDQWCDERPYGQVARDVFHIIIVLLAGTENSLAVSVETMY